MKISEILHITEGNVRCGEDKLHFDISHAFSSDLLSDVLTINRTGIMLITGAANLQAVRTAEIAEVSCILFARNKKATGEMIKLADEIGLVIIESPGSVFGLSGMLYGAGIKPLY